MPVERSPMISSRWPRPTFVIESIALTPVCSGSFTGWRSTTPGALNSSGRVSSVLIGPAPSSGRPSGSTTRPSSASPTGTLATRPVRLTGSPSFTCSHSPNSAAPTLSSSRLNASPTTPCSSSSISRATAFSSPYTRAIPSPTWSTVPTSARSVSTSYSSIRCFRIAVISSGRSFTESPSVRGLTVSSRSLGDGQLAPEPLEPPAHACVQAVRADVHDDAADQVRVDAARRLDLAARGLLDLLDQLPRIGIGELDGGRQLEVDPSPRARRPAARTRGRSPRAGCCVPCPRGAGRSCARARRRPGAGPPGPRSSRGGRAVGCAAARAARARRPRPGRARRGRPALRSGAPRPALP